MGFTRQEYWSGLPCRLPWDLLNPGTEPKSLMSLALASRFFTTSPTWEVQSGETTFELSSMTPGLTLFYLLILLKNSDTTSEQDLKFFNNL